MNVVIRYAAICFGVTISLLAQGSPDDTQLYWGDTHLHTGLSFDAYTFGTKGRPDDAYRYAKGLPIVHPVTGLLTKINRPLDFLIIADHAEALGVVARLLEGEASEVANTKAGAFIVETGKGGSQSALDEVYKSISLVGSGLPNDTGLTMLDLVDLHGENIRPAWYESIEAADEHNEPGQFSAIIGWEWTSQPGGANFHRVVFLQQDASVARQFLPYSALESENPEALWAWLDSQSEKTGAEFLAIPHGPNISAGLMFSRNNFAGEPMNKAYAETQARLEPAIEVTQIKGDSETLSLFSPEDQFADFETYNFLSIPTGKAPEPSKGDYVRSGLRTGLQLGAELGTNPFKMGMAAGTDSHTGLPTIEESSFGGKSGHDNKPGKRSGPSGVGASLGWDMGAAGFTGVWAQDNTRRAIFEAFKRKEIYASTGPRMSVRFFGGSDFRKSDLKKDIAARGYKKGVPMGGDLSVGKDAPSFIVSAMKDPDGANLDRIQIIKGWLKSDGTTEERVYDVALSGGRTDGATPVGNTVNLNTGEYTNDIGEPLLAAVWKDPDFDPTLAAFYYARVLEIPTPRYSLYDAIALGIDVKETGHPATLQERAYTSPIWYTPQK